MKDLREEPAVKARIGKGIGDNVCACVSTRASRKRKSPVGIMRMASKYREFSCMRWMIILFWPFASLATLLSRPRDLRSINVGLSRCPKVSGEGRLEYCDNGTDQQIYLSGELDIKPTDRNKENAADLLALETLLRKFKTRDKGIFRVVTSNAGGGEVDWHQELIMAVEDACIEDCRIITEVKGRCNSACNQLHITCVRNAKTILHKSATTCEHATTAEDDPRCNARDPFNPNERNLCSTRKWLQMSTKGTLRRTF